MTIVNAVIANDGRLVVTVEWTDGLSRVLDRDEAVRLGISLLAQAAHLFKTADEFSASIAHARSDLQPLHPSSILQ
jgi:hypothetical protein